MNKIISSHDWFSSLLSIIELIAGGRSSSFAEETAFQRVASLLASDLIWPHSFDIAITNALHAFAVGR